MIFLKIRDYWVERIKSFSSLQFSPFYWVFQYIFYFMMLNIYISIICVTKSFIILLKIEITRTSISTRDTVILSLTYKIATGFWILSNFTFFTIKNVYDYLTVTIFSHMFELGMLDSRSCKRMGKFVTKCCQALYAVKNTHPWNCAR